MDDYDLHDYESAHPSTFGRGGRSRRRTGAAAVAGTALLVLLIGGIWWWMSRPAPQGDADAGAPTAESPEAGGGIDPGLAGVNTPVLEEEAVPTVPATVTVTADALRLRASPPDGTVLGMAMNGTQLRTTGQRQEAGGLEWWEVYMPDSDTRTAWAAADYLEPAGGP